LIGLAGAGRRIQAPKLYGLDQKYKIGAHI
jgi:hypothetical protein